MARTYIGLGAPARAAESFDKLLPHVEQIRAMQAKCAPTGDDYAALQLAVEGLEEAAHHFTRRPHYYEHTQPDRKPGQRVYEGLGDLCAAGLAFEALWPYVGELRRLQQLCRPFGVDYQALNVPIQRLNDAAFHFTNMERFYSTRGDSTGRLRPYQPWER